MKNINLLSALIISCTMMACGGGSPESSKNKPDSLFPDGYTPVSSISSSSVASSVVASTSAASTSTGSSTSSSVGGAPNTIIKTALPILEKFDAVDGPSFFSTTYKPLSSFFTADPNNSFYSALAGLVENRILVGEGKLTFGNARFSIGQTYYAPVITTETPNPKTGTTVEGQEQTWGELDLSKDYKISFCIKAGTGTGKLEVYVNNNTSNAVNSKHGQGTNGSRLLSVGASALMAGKRVEIMVKGSATLFPGGTAQTLTTEVVGTSTSFIQLRAASSSTVTIDDLWIGYQDDLSTEPTASSCAAGEHLIAPPVSSSSSSSVASSDVSSVASSISSIVSSSESSASSSETSASSISSSEETSSSSSVSSSEVSSSSSSSQASSITALLVEDFNSADTTNFFTTTYKINPVDSSLPLYVVTSGGTRITFANGELSMNNARFSLGDKNPATATAAGVAPNGSYDLTKPYRIKFTITAFTSVGATAGNLVVYVDNNTTSAGSSFHNTIGSTASRLLNLAQSNSMVFPYDVVIESQVGTQNSFFQIRADSNVANVTIDNLTIEYQ